MRAATITTDDGVKDVPVTERVHFSQCIQVKHNKLPSAVRGKWLPPEATPWA